MSTMATVPSRPAKSTTTCYTRKDFIADWDFPIHPLHDFELNGESASYAPGHPRQWGDETHWLDFRKLIKDGQPERPYDSYYAAASPDHKLLAITSRSERVLIFDIETQELRQTLDGAGRMLFAPLTQTINRGANGPTPAYAIVCSASDEGQRSGRGNQLVVWELDERGRLLDQEEPIDASAFAQKAINAILPDLRDKHEWSEDFVKATSLHADFTTALSNVATIHRRRNNTTFDDARLGSFGSTSFGCDGNIFLYHKKNQSTQSGMRDPENLPHIVVMDVARGEELYRLFGHTDAIMWSAISPDDKHIASAAWDGSMRMYSAETGNLEWTKTGSGQAWTGAFSADSKHIVWSTGNGRALFVHNVADGKGLSSFPETLRDWCRSLAWHPDGQQIALCAGKHAYVWRPFGGEQGTVTQHYQIEDDKQRRSMASVSNIDWLKHERFLHLSFSDGTNLIYDTQKNTKELFMHPRGVDISWVDDGFHDDIHVTGFQDGYISVDGDGFLRYWSSGVETGGSWWDKVSEKKTSPEASKAQRKPLPLMGKYVMVTKPTKKGNAERQTETSDNATHNQMVELSAPQ